MYGTVNNATATPTPHQRVERARSHDSETVSLLSAESQNDNDSSNSATASQSSRQTSSDLYRSRAATEAGTESIDDQLENDKAILKKRLIWQGDHSYFKPFDLSSKDDYKIIDLARGTRYNVPQSVHDAAVRYCVKVIFPQTTEGYKLSDEPLRSEFPQSIHEAAAKQLLKLAPKCLYYVAKIFHSKASQSKHEAAAKKLLELASGSCLLGEIFRGKVSQSKKDAAEKQLLEVAIPKAEYVSGIRGLLDLFYDYCPQSVQDAAAQPLIKVLTPQVRDIYWLEKYFYHRIPLLVQDAAARQLIEVVIPQETNVANLNWLIDSPRNSVRQAALARRRVVAPYFTDRLTERLQNLGQALSEMAAPHHPVAPSNTDKSKSD